MSKRLGVKRLSNLVYNNSDLFSLSQSLLEHNLDERVEDYLSWLCRLCSTKKFADCDNVKPLVVVAQRVV